MPEVSIVTPTYNRGAVLPAAIESVQRQTIDDYEHIIVDDGSTDRTEAIVDPYRKADPRIRYLRLEDNGGHAAAMNRGIEAANGRYISFLDSDDTYTPNRLAVTHDRLDEPSSMTGGICHSFVSVREGGTHVDRVPEGEIDLTEFADQNVIRGLSNTMFNAEVCAAVGGFDESLASSVDYEFQLRVLEEYPLIGVSDPLSFHRKDIPGVQDNPMKIKQGLLGVLSKHHNRLSDRNVAIRLCRIGRASIDLGHTKEGLACMQAALALCPDDERTEIARQIGVTHLFHGDKRTARSFFIESIQQDPTNYKAAGSLLASLVPFDGQWSYTELRRWHNRVRGPIERAIH